MASPAFAPTHATGPRTEAGKAASSRNSLKHGLASGTLLLPGEDPAEFAALLQSLIADHVPASATEELLVYDMAKYHWLTDRAIRLQIAALAANDLNQLALFLRYQTANHRAFHKSLTALQTLRKSGKQFVSQSSFKPTKAEKLDFERDLSALISGPFTEADQDRFAEQHGLSKRHPALPPTRLPRNKR
jgi:hypothetical protein